MALCPDHLINDALMDVYAKLGDNQADLLIRIKLMAKNDPSVADKMITNLVDHELSKRCITSEWKDSLIEYIHSSMSEKLFEDMVKIFSVMKRSKQCPE